MKWKQQILFICMLFVSNVYFSAIAYAHPHAFVTHVFELNVEQNKSLNIVYSMYILPAFVDEVYKEADTDQNGLVSNEEGRSYVYKNIITFVRGELNGSIIKLIPTEIVFPARQDILSGQSPVNVLFTTNAVAAREEGNVVVWEYTKHYISEGDNADIVYIDGNIVQFKPLLLPKVGQLVSESNGIRFDLIDTKIQRDSALGLFSSTESASLQKNENFFVKSSQAMKRALERNYVNKDPTPLFAGIGIFLALFAGALHAVTPGHGKSLMAAFLVGKKESKWSDAVILALSITIAHTIIIFLLGIIFFYFSKQISVYAVIPYFEKINGVLLIGVAYYLLRHAYRNKLELHNMHHHHGVGGRMHSHDHDQDTRVHKIPYTGGKWDLFVAGLSGGVVPCVDALSILIAFVSIGRPGLGIVFVLFFSIGMACAIVSIGIILVLGKQKINFEERFKKTAMVYAPIGAAAFMIAVSCSLIF